MKRCSLSTRDGVIEIRRLSDGSPYTGDHKAFRVFIDDVQRFEQVGESSKYSTRVEIDNGVITVDDIVVFRPGTSTSNTQRRAGRSRSRGKGGEENGDAAALTSLHAHETPGCDLLFLMMFILLVTAVIYTGCIIKSTIDRCKVFMDLQK